MFGIDYKFEINEKKNTIKLAPTAKTWIMTTIMPLVFLVAPLLVLGYLDDSKKYDPDTLDSHDDND